MKKILASIATVVALTGFAAGAHAAGDNSPSGSSAVESFNSVHSGSVSATCSLKVEDGSLPTAAGLVSSLTSTTKGKISTVCNNATSTLAVTIDSTSPAAGNALAIPLSGYAETFELSSGSGAYSTTTPGFFNTANYTNLSNSYSATASTVDVAAKVAVASNLILPAGAYKVKVKATVTP